jgi:hypothetical protein
MRAMRRERGQASIEYVAIVALVVAILAAVIPLTAAGPALAGAVMDGLRRGLCVVTDGGCALKAAPCIVATSTIDERAGLDIVLVRVGRHSGILRQELSDGSIAITEIEDLEGGPRVGIGAHGHIHLGDLDIGIGGELQAALLAQLGHGRTFVVHSREAADELVDRLVHGSSATMLADLPIRAVRGALGMSEDGIPKADAVYYEGGAQGLFEAGLGPLVTRADLVVAATHTVGIRVDRRTGQRTLYMQIADRAMAPLTTLFGELGGSAEGTLVAGLTLDRQGHPVQFSVSGSRRLASGGTAPLTALIPSIGPLAMAGDRFELDAWLDLANAQNTALVRRFLMSLTLAGGPAELVDAAGALADRLRSDARLDARVYDVGSSVIGVDGSIALGARIGGDFSYERSSGRLVQAAGRSPEGWWEQRHDC